MPPDRRVTRRSTAGRSDTEASGSGSRANIPEITVSASGSLREINAVARDEDVLMAGGLYEDEDEEDEEDEVEDEGDDEEYGEDGDDEDDVEAVDGDYDSDTPGDDGNQYDDLTSANVAGSILSRIWEEMPKGAKETARRMYPLFVRLYSKHKQFSEYCTEANDKLQDGTPLIFSTKKTEGSSTHPAIQKGYTIRDEITSGYEILIGLACQLNPGLRQAFDSHVVDGDNETVPTTMIDDYCSETARTSASVGVYSLRFGGCAKYVIGHAVGSCFHQRLCGKEYVAWSTRLADVLTPQQRLDHRVDRRDYILVDLEPVRHLSGHQKWIAAGIESILIVLFDTTNPAVGTNTNIVDRSMRRTTLPARNILDIWQAVKAVTDNPDIAIPAQRDMPKFIEAHPSIQAVAGSVTAMSVYEMVRIIHMLIPLRESDSNPFRPLRSGAWLLGAPTLYRRMRWGQKNAVRGRPRAAQKVSKRRWDHSNFRERFEPGLKAVTPASRWTAFRDQMAAAMLDDGEAFNEGLETGYERRRDHRLRSFRIRIEALDKNGSWKDSSDIIKNGGDVKDAVPMDSQ